MFAWPFQTDRLSECLQNYNSYVTGYEKGISQTWKVFKLQRIFSKFERTFQSHYIVKQLKGQQRLGKFREKLFENDRGHDDLIAPAVAEDDVAAFVDLLLQLLGRGHVAHPSEDALGLEALGPREEVDARADNGRDVGQVGPVHVGVVVSDEGEGGAELLGGRHGRLLVRLV